MLNHELQHAPAPPGASALSELSAQLQAQKWSPCAPVLPLWPAQPSSPTQTPFPAHRQAGLLHTLGLCPAWQGHCTGLLQGRFAWRGKWGNVGRCCYKQLLISGLESIIQSPGVQKPRPEDATILILNCRCQMNHIVYKYPVW